MENLSNAFRRNPDGSWTCVQAVVIDGPTCPIRVAPGSTFSPGTRVEGLDLAAWIDEHASKEVWLGKKPWRAAH